MGVSVGAGSAPARAGSLDSSALLEREQELASVDGLLDAARDGAGGLVLITGPAGIGKTSLLDACAQAADRRGMVASRAIGDELVMGSSFATVRELLWRAVQAAGERAWEGAAGLAAPVFRAEGDRPAERALAASVLHGLYWLVAGLAERAPMALFVDDAQWLDDASAGFLAYLARRLGQLPVLLIVAMRTGEPVGGTSPLHSLAELAGRELRISPLTEDASGTLVRRRLGPRADHELCRSCYDATGGNPFFLRELTAALDAEPGRPTVELARSVRELGAGTVGRTVLVRLARLGGDCERLAQAVAVLGPGCSVRHAAALSRLERVRPRRRRTRCARPICSQADGRCRSSTRSSARHSRRSCLRHGWPRCTDARPPCWSPTARVQNGSQCTSWPPSRSASSRSSMGFGAPRAKRSHAAPPSSRSRI